MTKTTALFILNAARKAGLTKVTRSNDLVEESDLQREVSLLRWQVDQLIRENASLRDRRAGPVNYLTVAEAAKKANRTEGCIRWNCLHKNLGNKVHGVYRITPDQLRRHFGLA
jgi:hypothetical protein